MMTSDQSAKAAEALELLPEDMREPAIAWQRLAVGLKDVQPLARRIGLGTVRVDGARVQARRAAGGAINLVPASTVKAGQAADLIATELDPLTNIATLKHATFVMRNGRVVRQ